MLRIMRIIHLKKSHRKSKENVRRIDLPACVAGSRLPINNLVLTTLVGPLIARIWNCEEDERKKEKKRIDQFEFQFN